MPRRTVVHATIRERELEERLEELRSAVAAALQAHEHGEPPAAIFDRLRARFEHVPPGRWNEQNVVDKAHEWTALYGEPPADIDWNPHGLRTRGRPAESLERWIAGDWPSTNTVKRIFGRWNLFLIAAGYEPREQARRHGPGGGKGLEHLPEWHGWEVITFHRSRAGLTQAALADRSRISINYVGNIERGEQTNPTVRLVLALAHGLAVPAAVLLDDTGRKVE